MLRNKSLIPLSQQHHNGLALCVLTERSLGSDGSFENVQKLAARAVERYEIELKNHFEIEEQVLFPEILKQQPEHGLTLALISEHRRIEGLIESLRAAPSAELLRTLISVLRAHIRTEENQLFQEIQKTLPREILDSVGKEIDAKAVRVCL